MMVDIFLRLKKNLVIYKKIYQKYFLFLKIFCMEKNFFDEKNFISKKISHIILDQNGNISS